MLVSSSPFEPLLSQPYRFPCCRLSLPFDSAPLLGKEPTGGNNINTITAPSHGRPLEPSIDEESQTMGTTTSTCIPCGSPATLEVRAPSPPSSPQAAQAGLPPPRATLILPDSMVLGPPSAGTSGPLDHQDAISRGAAQALAGSLRNGDLRIGTRSAVSSPRMKIGRHGGTALRLKRQPESTPGSVTSRFSRSGTRTPRVLKTSVDFRETIRRVYKVGAKVVLAHIRPLCFFR